MNERPEIVATIPVETEPEETWAMNNSYGVRSAVCMGALFYVGDIVTLFVEGKRKGRTEVLRMQPEALDRFCKAWIEYRNAET